MLNYVAMNKEDNSIFILGVGHNTIVYVDLAKACGYHIAGLYHFNDERVGEVLHGFPIIDTNDNLFKKETLAGLNFGLSMGDNKIRADLAQKIREKGGNLPTLIHPAAVVSQYAKIGNGVAIYANAVVQANVNIDNDSVISHNACLAHNSSIGKACYVAFQAIVGAYVNVRQNVFVGQGAILISAKADYISENSIIGAGSVVTKNVEPNSVVAGNPARVIRKINE
jgi:sugar O-acyltransferase (sialic acid O-acetyltransferase NeuD family)